MALTAKEYEEKARNDVELFDTQFKIFKETKRFMNALKGAVSSTNSRTQYFRDDAEKVYRALSAAHGWGELKGMGAPSKKKQDKEGFFLLVNEAWGKVDKKVRYKVLDKQKLISGLLIDDKTYFEISVSLHNKPVFDGDGVNVIGNPKDYVRQFVEGFDETHYQLKQIKSNQITYQFGEDKQISMKITKKTTIPTLIKK